MRAAGLIACLAYNFSLVALFAYLVTVHDWSAWWFIAVIMLMASSSSDD